MITTDQILFKRTFEKYKIGMIHNEIKNIQDETYKLINNHDIKTDFKKFNNSNKQIFESKNLLKALEKI